MAEHQRSDHGRRAYQSSSQFHQINGLNYKAYLLEDPASGRGIRRRPAAMYEYEYASGFESVRSARVAHGQGPPALATPAAAAEAITLDVACQTAWVAEQPRRWSLHATSGWCRMTVYGDHVGGKLPN